MITVFGLGTNEIVILVVMVLGLALPPAVIIAVIIVRAVDARNKREQT